MHSSFYSGGAALRRLPGETLCRAYSNGFGEGQHRPMGLAEMTGYTHQNCGSKPAPTGDWCRHKKTGLGDPLESWPGVRARPEMRSNCGSGLAREEDVTFSSDVDCYAAFASKPAPTRVVGFDPHQSLRKCGITFSPMFFRVSSCAHCGTVPIWQMNRISSAPASIRRCT